MNSNIDPKSIEKFEALARDVMEAGKAVGLAVAAVDDCGNTIYQKFFGYRNQEKKLPIDESTVFGLASVSKSFIALAATQLAEKGVIDIHAPVSTYLPHFSDNAITSEHLLSHSAGYYPQESRLISETVEELGLTVEEEGDFAYSEKVAAHGARILMENLNRQTDRIGDPGEFYSYSNDGYDLMSELIRASCGEKTTQAYVKNNILLPLSMDRSGYDYFWEGDNVSMLYYGGETGEQKVTNDFCNNAAILQGRGGMKSTISDMKKYVAMYLNRGKGLNGSRLASRKGIANMMRPKIASDLNEYYGYGLFIRPLDDLAVIGHDGSMTGISSEIAWSYEAGAGVIVLCNTSNVNVAKVATAAMRMLNGKDPTADAVTYRRVKWAESLMDEVAGEYVSSEGGVYALMRKDDGFVLDVIGLTGAAYPINRYMLMISMLGRDLPATVYFDDDGKAQALGFGGRIVKKSR